MLDSIAWALNYSQKYHHLIKIQVRLFKQIIAKNFFSITGETLRGHPQLCALMRPNHRKIVIQIGLLTNPYSGYSGLSVLVKIVCITRKVIRTVANPISLGPLITTADTSMACLP